MNVRVVGLNHHTASIDVREALAFSPHQVAAVLDAWQDISMEIEAVLLSTCNRIEFYVASEDKTLPMTEDLLKFLLRQKKSPPLGYLLASQVFTLDGPEAAEHLFSVASGLDSMVLGEAQILGQVKSAYQLALEASTVGTLLHGLFQSALKTAKEVAENTELHRHRVSIPSVAVADFALQIFERLDDKRVLVFGAGDMGRETLQYLREHGATSITVLNRHRERAEALARDFGGRVDHWDRRFSLMQEADLVVSTTGASTPVVTLGDYETIERSRGGRVLFLLDLALPRDFDPAIGDRPGVYLYSIDDLKEACERNRGLRDQEIPKANRLVQQASRRFFQDLNHRHSGDMIRRLRERWGKTKEVELTRLFNKLPDLSEKEREEIRYAFDRLIGKFLHPPLESLRDESRQGVPHKLLEALARLFQLRDGS